ncbi:LppX_LprAFG lipoprotein [Nocardioides sp.]|uniref:LppX_LprAFG lipoprotein n=1 Tax=Nocardioides sp. TaxID=35761 RepID=UPI002625C74F|nr:LppX_LprAFG lipoprotein [Nocardioides sp.]
MLTTGRLLTACLALSLLAGCGSSTTSGSKESTAPTTPAQVLAQAKKTLDETSGLNLGITATGVPTDVTALLSGSGTLTHAPGFDGSITVQYAGLKPQVPIVAVDGKVYAQLPLSVGWQTIDPSEYGAPDPATLAAASGGLSDWLTATTGLVEGDKVRGGVGNKEILTSYSGTLPAKSGQLLVPLITKDLDVTYTVTDSEELRQIVLKGDIYNTGDTETYTIDLDHYGTSKTITAPK